VQRLAKAMFSIRAGHLRPVAEHAVALVDDALFGVEQRWLSGDVPCLRVSWGGSGSCRRRRHRRPRRHRVHRRPRIAAPPRLVIGSMTARQALIITAAQEHCKDCGGASICGPHKEQLHRLREREHLTA